jgi:hypothetical protein
MSSERGYKNDIYKGKCHPQPHDILWRWTSMHTMLNHHRLPDHAKPQKFCRTYVHKRCLT